MPILINDNTARVQYTATSGQTVFAVPFEFFENSDLKVYRNSTLQTITTHYTLTGAGVTGGGNLTFVSGVTLNDIITIVRDIPIKRVTDFPLSGPFNIAALNLQLDQLTAMVQEVNTLVTTRVPLLAEFDQPSAFSALPTQANRANNYFVFDSNGNPAVASSALAVTDFTQAGTGAVLRTAQAKMRDFVSVKDFGAVGDGTTNDTAAVQAALTAHQAVYFPAGTYDLAQVNLRTGQQIVGDGIGVTVLRHRTGTNSFGLFGTGVSDITISNLTLDGNSAGNLTGGMGLRIEGVSNNITVKNVKATNWRFDGLVNVGTGSNFDVVNCDCSNNLRDGISITNATFNTVQQNQLNSNGRYGCVFGVLANNSAAVQNTANGNGESGLTASGFGSSLTQILFANNTVNSNTQYGINCVTVSNVTYLRNNANSNGVDGLGVTLTSPFAQFIGNRAASNGRVGLSVDSESHYSVVSDNVSLSNGWEGIGVYRSYDVKVANNTVLNNGVRNAIDPDPTGYNHEVGVFVYDTETSPNQIASSRCIITGNTIADTGSNTQKRGIRFQDAFSNSTGAIVKDNVLFGATTANMTFVAGNLAFAGSNSGLFFEQSGTATILSGTTSIAVVFANAMSYTPTAQDFVLTPSGLATNDPGELYPTAISAAGFTLNCRNNPGASNLTVGWRVRKEVF